MEKIMEECVNETMENVNEGTNGREEGNVQIKETKGGRKK
jgi:hypothetical protein